MRLVIVFGVRLSKSERHDAVFGLSPKPSKPLSKESDLSSVVLLCKGTACTSLSPLDQGAGWLGVGCWWGGGVGLGAARGGSEREGR